MGFSLVLSSTKQNVRLLEKLAAHVCLLTELHSVKYHPLQCLKSVTKNNVRPIKKFKSMRLYDKRLKGVVHFQIKMSL